MSTYIKTITDLDGNVILPRTRSDAIYTPDNELLNDVLVISDDAIEGSPIAIPAENVSYSNNLSGLVGDNIQEAIDEIVDSIDNISISLSDLGITSSVTELNYTDGVTSSIQTQINNIKPIGSIIYMYKTLGGL